MNYLLDTNICVYFMRGKRNVAAKIAEIGQEHFFISEMTLGELLYGAQCSDRPSENISAVHVFCQYVTILPTANIWNEFAVQKAFLRKKGQLIEDADTCCEVSKKLILAFVVEVEYNYGNRPALMRLLRS